MDNIGRLNYLYKQKKTLEFKINIILTEMGFVKNDSSEYEELIKQYNKLNQTGQEKALDYLSDLILIEKYNAKNKS